MPDFRSRLRAVRERSGIAQRDLAARAGVTRQTVHALEAGRYLPATSVALRLARVLGCRVEDLFTLDDEPRILETEAPPRSRLAAGERVAVGRVGARWIAHALPGDPGENVRVAADGLVLGRGRGPRGTVRIEPLAPAEALAGNLLVAGCAPALGLLAARLLERAPTVRARWVHASSEAALAHLAGGRVHLAGAHLFDERSAEYNVDAARRSLPGRALRIVTLARWEMGLVVPSGNPRRLRSASDCTRRGLRVARRERGSGARALFERLLGGAGVHADRRPATGLPAGPSATSHAEVAELVARGQADVGVSLPGMARARGLDFVPLAEERFDLVVPLEIAEEPGWTALADVLASGAFRREVCSLGGHDARLAGELVAEVRP